jgi:hypothetical protein
MSTDQKGEGEGLSELKIDNNMCSSCLIFRQYNNYQCICSLAGSKPFMIETFGRVCGCGSLVLNLKKQIKCELFM